MPDKRDQHSSDETLAAELADYFSRCDPTPSTVLDAARAAIEFRDFDVQLADILRDSALEDKELAGVRGVGQRLLTFRRGDSFLELDVTSRGEQRDLSGYLLPGHTGELIVDTPAGEHRAAIDRQGRFRLIGLQGGPARFSVRLGANIELRTAWIGL